MLVSLALAIATATDASTRALPTLTVGPIKDTAGHALTVVPDLELGPCATRPIAPLPPPSHVVAPVTGQIVLQVTIRRRRADLVAVSAMDADYAWLAPCVERRIATVRWPVRSGTFEVPVVVTPPASPPPVPRSP
jgi:hypothetical protein